MLISKAFPGVLVGGCLHMPVILGKLLIISQQKDRIGGLQDFNFYFKFRS